MNKIDFLKYVENFCKKNKIEFITFPGTTAFTKLANAECSGFFEENQINGATLGIANDLDDQTFFEILAHEFSHACQFLEKSPIWTNCRLTPEEIATYSKELNMDLIGFETGDLFEYWLKGKIELTTDVLNDLVLRTTDIEFDCEKRTVSLIKELGLNICPATYSQKSNAYLITYFYALRTRKWTTPGKATYTKEEFYKTLPSKIDPAFCQALNDATIYLLEKHCLYRKNYGNYFNAYYWIHCRHRISSAKRSSI